jgi:hypothetical protein
MLGGGAGELEPGELADQAPAAVGADQPAGRDDVVAGQAVGLESDRAEVAEEGWAPVPGPGPAARTTRPGREHRRHRGRQAGVTAPR